MSIEKTVDDLAIPIDAYPHLHEDQTLQDAIAVIRSFTCEDQLRFSGLLILNGQEQLVGRVTVCELLQALEPRLLKKKKRRRFEGFEADYPNLAILWEESFFKKCRKRGGKPIKDFLSPISSSVKATDPLLKALYIMIHKNENNLPVLRKKTVVGVIRIKEVFAAICDYCDGQFSVGPNE